MCMPQNIPSKLKTLKALAGIPSPLVLIGPLYATTKKELARILKILEGLNSAFDIELVLLHGFVQTKSAKGNGRKFGVPSLSPGEQY